MLVKFLSYCKIGRKTLSDYHTQQMDINGDLTVFIDSFIAWGKLEQQLTWTVDNHKTDRMEMRIISSHQLIVRLSEFTYNIERRVGEPMDVTSYEMPLDDWFINRQNSRMTVYYLLDKIIPALEAANEILKRNDSGNGWLKFHSSNHEDILVTLIELVRVCNRYRNT